MRLPGGAGSAILAYVVERVVLFKTEHAARGLVAAVDVVTAPGFTPELSPRQRPGRITRLITPKCVFNLRPPQPPLGQPPSRRDPGGGAPTHRALSFAPRAQIPETPALTAEARRLLYGPVKEKLAQAYPHLRGAAVKAFMLNLLKTHFGFDQFRPLQEEIIRCVMAQRDALVLMPTGGGKSLCFQLPALMLPGLTLVISPLIALMKDQVDALQANGIPAEFINSTLTRGGN